MSIADSELPRFNTRTGELIRRCLRVCRYYDDSLKRITFLVRIAMFRSSLLPIVRMMHARRASPFCRSHARHVKMWPGCTNLAFRSHFSPVLLVGDVSLRSDGPRRVRSMPLKEVERFFDDNKADFAPDQSFAPRLGHEPRARGSLALWT